MINVHDILETTEMIDEEYLDIRAVTMGISLLDCCDSNIDKSCEKVYNKITRLAEDPVKTGENTEREYGTPIINKRISVTPIATLAAVSGGDPVRYTHTLKRCAQAVGVNFIGGYSALAQRGYATGDRELMESVPKALAETEHVCASANVGSTKVGINMNAVELMGRMVKEAAELTKDCNCISTAELAVFYNAPEDNPFMADALRGIEEADCVINVSVSGPGVVHAALAKMGKSLPVSELTDIIKKIAFKVARMGQLVGTLVSERLGIPFGIADLSLAPAPAIEDSIAYILEEMDLESCGACGTTACLAMLNGVVKKSDVMASGTIGELSDASIPVGEDAGMTIITRASTLCLEGLEAVTTVYSVGLDMVVIPGEATPEVTSDIIADEAATSMVNSETTTVRAIPAIGKKVGEELEFGGLLGSDPVMSINQADYSVMIRRKRRIPAPIRASKS